MVTESTLSARAHHLIRTFQAAFAALDDLKDPTEQQQIAEVIAAHLRSSQPLALLGTADVLEPLSELVIVGADGSRIELRMIDGLLNVYAVDTAGADAAVPLPASRAEEMARGVRRVLAGGAG